MQKKRHNEYMQVLLLEKKFGPFNNTAAIINSVDHWLDAIIQTWLVIIKMLNNSSVGELIGYLVALLLPKKSEEQ